MLHHRPWVSTVRVRFEAELGIDRVQRDLPGSNHGLCSSRLDHTESYFSFSRSSSSSSMLTIAWISSVLDSCATWVSADGCRNELCAHADVRLWVECKRAENSNRHQLEQTSGAKISSRRYGMTELDGLTKDGVSSEMANQSTRKKN